MVQNITNAISEFFSTKYAPTVILLAVCGVVLAITVIFN